MKPPLNFDDVRLVMSALGHLLHSKDEQHRWLKSYHPKLGGIPMELIKEGEAERVREYIYQQIWGD